MPVKKMSFRGNAQVEVRFFGGWFTWVFVYKRMRVMGPYVILHHHQKDNKFVCTVLRQRATVISEYNSNIENDLNTQFEIKLPLTEALRSTFVIATSTT